MSDINGNGYGEKHNWKRGDTEQHWSPEFRNTYYSCINCGQRFRHYYHTIPDIFDAIKSFEVKEECKKDGE